MPGLPTDLAVFRAGLWPGRDAAEKYGAWVAARSRWKISRGLEVLPDDDAVSAAFPDGEFRVEDV